jgi:hypothetical protein
VFADLAVAIGAGVEVRYEPAGQRSEGSKGALTEAQEVWALRKMGYFKIGQRS